LPDDGGALSGLLIPCKPGQPCATGHCGFELAGAFLPDDGGALSALLIPYRPGQFRATGHAVYW